MIIPKEGTRCRTSLDIAVPYIAAAFAMVIFAQTVRAEVVEKAITIRGTTVHYKVVLPNGYDSSSVYPAVFALGGGAQTMNSVDAVLNRYFRAEAEKRGYIVVAPAAPGDHLVLWDGADVFPEFLKKILTDYKIENGKFHIAGPSNGGIAALEIAAAYPQYFQSITAFPGYLVELREDKLKAISKMCVFLYVGELDDDVWHAEMQKEADILRSMGTVADYIVEKGQPHGLQTLAGNNAGRLFDGFEESKKGCSN
jgi:poly(3-hydroxybutyrate) depolymerase